MITFYPGPSKVYEQVGVYMQEAVESGMLSMNHRSEPFMRLLESAVSNLKRKLDIPSEYEVYLVSSATECWEIIAQSLISSGSLHLFNGAFGEKWMEYTQKITSRTAAAAFGVNEEPVLDDLHFDADDIICITQNETSNGTQVSSGYISSLRSRVPNLIAVDATSSMAGIALPWEAADVWYASVQKCFGLPAGLAVMVSSPRAVAQAIKVNDRRHYNSLLFIRDNFLKNQTPYTPNILGIYLLDCVMQQVPPISEVAAQTEKRAAEWYGFLSRNGYQIVAENPEIRSQTVVAVQDTRERISMLKKSALTEGIVLGNGYGADKDYQFRIANFPAITNGEIEQLRHFLLKNAPANE